MEPKMKRTFAALVLLCAGGVVPAAGAGQPAVAGTWEAARAPNDERLYIVLSDKGKAEVVEEYELPVPGKKQRARSSTFGTWVRKGNEIVVTYGNVMDRLRYVAREPLATIGLTGSAPALRPVGKPDARSKVGSEVLWKAPHDYHAKPDESARAPASAPEAGGEPIK
jgi:hypothetical protein